MREYFFSFFQELPETFPPYSYPFEWDNVAVLPISMSDQLRTEEISFIAPSKVKQSEKKEIVIREVRFSSVLVPGIRTSEILQPQGGARS